MLDDSDFSSRPEITRFLHRVSEAVTNGLAGYNVSLSPPETLWAAMSWLMGESENQSTSPEIIAEETPVEDAALSIVSLLLASIAEERPGTYPFDHAATIPVPMPVLMRTIHALAIIVNVSTQNGRFNQTGYLTGAIGALARIAAGQDFMGQETIVPDGRGEPDLTIDPPYCFVPQPGLAFCARVIEGVARDLRDGSLAPSVDGQIIDVVQLVHSLENDALGLRLLNRAFGVSPDSPE